ncbi:hypothetical protein [Natrialbaceae archaeon AArc-T1-2]|uniref:hypothetical protein n=1 Tax=Natrialbaceae archaeon AArc-T1-2 TaxID=3053904 RepID=UPI00255B0B88|nr:hypothetical protein [Natrialbaceae archaeon AArc-T1-2]WIV68831.1 hypothetical protein QQ977_16135 [Natrialbaceae archaeon AArc-T1-2]
MGKAVSEDFRLPLIIAFLGIAGMFFAGHQTGRIYPAVLFIFFGTVVLLLGIALFGGSLFGTVSGAILVAIGYRLSILHVPATTIGEATTRNAVWMEDVVSEGTTAVIPSPFYREAPLHILHSSASAMILDIHSQQTFYIYAILLAIALPLVAIILARSIGVTQRRALAAAALLAIATTEGIRRSYWVIPQAHAAVWYWLILLFLMKMVTKPDKRFYEIILVLTVAIAFTHKLPLLLIALIFVALLGLYFTDRLIWKDIAGLTPTQQVLSLGALIGSVTLAQWLYIGGHINHVVARVLRLFRTDGPVGSSGFEPTAATEARTGILANFYEYPTWMILYVERLHIFWILLIGGITWLCLLVYTSDDRHRPEIYVLLAGAAASVVLIPISVATVDALNPTRLLMLGEPILIVLAVGMVAKAVEIAPDNVPWVKLFFVFILATQVFAASAAPDYENTPRYYLDSTEAHSKTMLCEYSEGPVYTDQNYHRVEGIDRENCGIFDRYSREPTDALYNANVTPSEHPTIAYRHDLDLYQGYNSRWHLTWNPEREFSANYSSIYSNEDVTVFHNTRQ